MSINYNVQFKIYLISLCELFLFYIFIQAGIKPIFRYFQQKSCYAQNTNGDKKYIDIFRYIQKYEYICTLLYFFVSVILFYIYHFSSQILFLHLTNILNFIYTWAIGVKFIKKIKDEGLHIKFLINSNVLIIVMIISFTELGDFIGYLLNNNLITNILWIFVLLMVSIFGIIFRKEYIEKLK
jgi:hypothetical protein